MSVLHSSSKANDVGIVFTTSNTIHYAEDFNAAHVTNAVPSNIFFAGAAGAISSDAGFQWSAGFFNVSGNMVITGNISTQTLNVSGSATFGGMINLGNLSVAGSLQTQSRVLANDAVFTLNVSSGAAIIGSAQIGYLTNLSGILSQASSQFGFITNLSGFFSNASSQTGYVTNLSGEVIGFNLSVAGTITVQSRIIANTITDLGNLSVAGNVQVQSRTLTNDAIITGNTSTGSLVTGSGLYYVTNIAPYLEGAGGGTLAGQAAVSGTVYLNLFIVPLRCTLTGSFIAINSAAGNVGVAVYVASGTGTDTPDGGSLIWNHSKAEGVSSNSLFSSNVTLSRGVYWYGIMVDNNSTNFQRTGGVASYLQSGGTLAMAGRTYTTTVWTFSSNCPATAAANTGPHFGLRVAVVE